MVTNTLADQIYEKLEKDILTGVYKRGDSLTELALSQSLNVSRTPVREALRRLEQDHIIESRGKGMLVPDWLSRIVISTVLMSVRVV